MPAEFLIDQHFNVPGVGLVVAGADETRARDLQASSCICMYLDASSEQAVWRRCVPTLALALLRMVVVEEGCLHMPNS
eukprot:6177334-Pleurochrysis_carterae.AAC.4